MKKLFVLTSMLVTLGVATASAQAQDPGESKQQPKPPSGQKEESTKGALNAADRQFMMQAAQGGLGEIEIAKLGASKAANDEVKKFSQRMVDDHTKANDELKSLADKKGVTLPNELTKAQKATRDRLDKLSGDKFDRPFMAQMISDHKKTNALFQKQEKIAKDPDLKQWTTSTLPMLQDHLKRA